MKVLITAGKSASAIKLWKAFDGHEVVLADYGEMPNLSSATYQLVSIGDRNNDTLAHSILNCCLDLNVDLVLPLCKLEVEALVKASILFEEFNVNILVPDMSTYERYLNIDDKNYKNWVVFQKGLILFATQETEELKAYGLHHQLSGAFHVSEANDETKLNLITINC